MRIARRGERTAPDTAPRTSEQFARTKEGTHRQIVRAAVPALCEQRSNHKIVVEGRTRTMRRALAMRERYVAGADTFGVETRRHRMVDGYPRAPTASAHGDFEVGCGGDDQEGSGVFDEVEGDRLLSAGQDRRTNLKICSEERNRIVRLLRGLDECFKRSALNDDPLRITSRSAICSLRIYQAIAPVLLRGRDPRRPGSPSPRRKPIRVEAARLLVVLEQLDSAPIEAASIALLRVGILGMK